MNCTDLDGLIADAESMATSGADWVFGILITLLILVSLIFIGAGQRWARPLSALTAGAFGTVFVYMLTGLGLECLWRIIISVASGILAAVLALFLTRAAVFVLGGGSAGVVAHLLYNVITGETNDLFVSRPPTYYITLGSSILVGSVIAHFQKNIFLRIATSTLGGGGIAFAIHLVVDRVSDVSMSSYVSIGIVGTSAILGTYVQTRCFKKRRAVASTEDSASSS